MDLHAGVCMPFGGAWMCALMQWCMYVHILCEKVTWVHVCAYLCVHICLVQVMNEYVHMYVNMCVNKMFMCVIVYKRGYVYTCVKNIYVYMWVKIYAFIYVCLCACIRV